MKKISLFMVMLLMISVSTAQVQKKYSKNIDKKEFKTNELNENKNEIFNTIKQAGFAQIVELGRPYYKKGMNFEEFIVSTGKKPNEMKKEEMVLMKEIHMALEKNLTTSELLRRPLPINIKDIFTPTPTFPNSPLEEVDCKFWCKVVRVIDKIGDFMDDLRWIIKNWPK